MSFRTTIVGCGVAVALLLATAGCQHPRNARIEEHAALFQSLDPAVQRIIREGLVDYGFTPVLVYMALGKPNRSAAAESESGRVETWTYRNFVYGNTGAVKLAANLPGNKPYGPIVSSNAPGGPSIFSTKAGPVQPTISDGSDAAVGTLQIEFRNGRVSTLRVDP